MRAMIGCVVVLALNAGLVADDKKANPIDAKKLVGRWEPKDKKAGPVYVIEFRKDGTLVIVADQKGKELRVEGTYKVDGNKLVIALKVGDKEQPATHNVTKLTDSELVSTDGKGTEETLVRIKDK